MCPRRPVSLGRMRRRLWVPASRGRQLGLPHQKIVTFLNLSTGNATLQLNGRVFRTFDNATDFYLANVNGEDQFGLFIFYLKQATGCSMRPLIFFAGKASEPEVITDFAPCTDEM